MLTYTELIELPTFKERFLYLKLNGRVSEPTFDFERYLNQVFYRSLEWRELRRRILLRDNYCDLGVDGYNIFDQIIIHHINPITPYDIKNRSEKLFDLDNLITTCKKTHNAIHYGDESFLLTNSIVERERNDTKLW